MSHCPFCDHLSVVEGDACQSLEKRILAGNCLNCDRRWVMKSWRVTNNLDPPRHGRVPRWEEEQDGPITHHDRLTRA